MYYTKEYPVNNVRESGKELVEITLIPFELTGQRALLYNMLHTYAVDDVVVRSPQGDKITFRFTSYDWNKTLRHILKSRRVTVVEECRAAVQG